MVLGPLAVSWGKAAVLPDSCPDALAAALLSCLGVGEYPAVWLYRPVPLWLAAASALLGVAAGAFGALVVVLLIWCCWRGGFGLQVAGDRHHNGRGPGGARAWPAAAGHHGLPPLRRGGGALA